MNKKPNNEMEDELRSEYDFNHVKEGVRGKYVERYRGGTNLVRLAPDVASAFPDEELFARRTITAHQLTLFDF